MVWFKKILMVNAKAWKDMERKKIHYKECMNVWKNKRTSCQDLKNGETGRIFITYTWMADLSKQGTIYIS